VNEVPSITHPSALRGEVEPVYACNVAGGLALTEDMVINASSGRSRRSSRTTRGPCAPQLVRLARVDLGLLRVSSVFGSLKLPVRGGPRRVRRSRRSRSSELPATVNGVVLPGCRGFVARGGPRRYRPPTGHRRPPSGRDLSRTVIWAGIVAPPETIPAQIEQWHDSRPVRAARSRSRRRRLVKTGPFRGPRHPFETLPTQCHEKMAHFREP